MSRRILFNASNLKVGGGLQAALATIREALSEPRCREWHFVLSRELETLLDSEAARHPHRFTLIHPSPARSLASRHQLRRFANQQPHDAVFTFMGPSHVRFAPPHLMGMNNAWITSDTSEAFGLLLNNYQRLWMWAWARYSRSWARKADAWVTETESSKRDIAECFQVPRNRVSVAPNTPAALYRNAPNQPAADKADVNEIKILCFGAPHPHKRFPFCADVGAALNELDPSVRFKFLVTIPEDSSEWQRLRNRAKSLGVLSNFENRGFIPPDQGPDLYRESSVVFLPTILECFSATYPEAMAMSRPLVTSDRAFARSVCGSAALYFDPPDAFEAARAILSISCNSELRTKLISDGHQKLGQLPTQRERLHLYINALEELITGEQTAGNR